MAHANVILKGKNDKTLEFVLKASFDDHNQYRFCSTLVFHVASISIIIKIKEKRPIKYIKILCKKNCLKYFKTCYESIQPVKLH